LIPEKYFSTNQPNAYFYSICEYSVNRFTHMSCQCSKPRSLFCRASNFRNWQTGYLPALTRFFLACAHLMITAQTTAIWIQSNFEAPTAGIELWLVFR